ncbi:MAG: membrane protein insertion efficiency factor YidD [Candidatus Margulisiibacteriota bacterium]
MKRIIIILIRLYQKAVSPLSPPACRFYPTCSDYCICAITKYGLIRGIIMGTGRLLRCNQFFKGGFDPVK